MKLKKWLLTVLSVVCIGSMAFGLTACGDDDGNGSDNDNSNVGDSTNNGDDGVTVLQDVNYTLVLTDQEGDAVVSAELRLMQGETQIATGMTDSNGKITGTAKEGNYVVVYEALPEGYLADDYSVEITISTTDAVVELSAINNIPNGTAERPYTFIPDATGYMQVSLPAGATHYYIVPRPMGRKLIVEGTEYEVIYGDNTYTGQAEITFESDASDTNAVELIALVNKSATENTITLAMPVPPGSNADVAIKAVLDTATTAEVKGSATVYYTWTATESGTLTMSTSSANANMYMYNDNTYKATEWGAESVSLEVNVGDIILIQVGVAGTPEATEVNEITFTLTLVTAE